MIDFIVEAYANIDWEFLKVVASSLMTFGLICLQIVIFMTCFAVPIGLITYLCVRGNNEY